MSERDEAMIDRLCHTLAETSPNDDGVDSIETLLTMGVLAATVLDGNPASDEDARQIVATLILKGVSDLLLEIVQLTLDSDAST